MNVIRQTGTVSECVCSGRFMLLTEIMWYYFIHAQVEPMQLAKSEADTRNQDHPTEQDEKLLSPISHFQA